MNAYLELVTGFHYEQLWLLIDTFKKNHGLAHPTQVAAGNAELFRSAQDITLHRAWTEASSADRDRFIQYLQKFRQNGGPSEEDQPGG